MTVKPRAFRVTDDLWDKLSGIAMRSDISVSEVIRLALERYVASELSHNGSYSVTKEVLRTEKVWYEFTPRPQGETLDQAGSLDEPTKKPGS